MSNNQIEDESFNDLVALDLCKVYPLSDGSLLMYNSRNFRRVLVANDVFATVINCNVFRTIDEHIAHIINLNPGLRTQQAEIRKIIQSLTENGMMVSAKSKLDLLKGVDSLPDTESEFKTPIVAIITCDRPESLDRLLQSIAENNEQAKCRCIYVVDNSRQEENINQNQEVVKKFEHKVDGGIVYFGFTQQNTFLSKLIGLLPEHENEIRFLADPSLWQEHWTSGLSRNLAILLSCGHRLVIFDDDIICKAYNSAQPRADVTFSDDPREASFYGNEKDWLGLHQELKFNPINGHSRYLGMTFSSALQTLGETNFRSSGMRNATAMLESELLPNSRILVTECGTLGCPGTGNNTWLPDMNPRSLQRLEQSETIAHNALNSRMVWSGRNQPHFAPRSNMSPITGLDNRQMLAPYFPAFRGEDKFFGYILDFIFPSSLVLDFPWAVPHSPIPHRVWKERDRDFGLRPSFPFLHLEKLLEHKSLCKAQSPEDRFHALSAWFRDMASSSEEFQTGLHRDSVLQMTSERLKHLNNLLSTEKSLPTEWREYLEKGIAQLKSNLDIASGPEFVVDGLPNRLQGEELISFWKEAWAGYATALTAWPEIREKAKTIIDGGLVLEN